LYDWPPAYNGLQKLFRTREGCYDFKNIFAEKFSKKMALLTQNTASLRKNGHNFGFQEKRQFFRRNGGKSLKILIITSIPVNVAHPILYFNHLKTFYWIKVAKSFWVLKIIQISKYLPIWPLNMLLNKHGVIENEVLRFMDECSFKRR
jgi:hypothetical protein